MRAKFGSVPMAGSKKVSFNFIIGLYHIWGHIIVQSSPQKNSVHQSKHHPSSDTIIMIQCNTMNTHIFFIKDVIFPVPFLHGHHAVAMSWSKRQHATRRG